VFDGLTLEQAQILIQNSRFKQYKAGDTIYQVGGIGDEMLILIKGKLSVMSATGLQLGETLPGQSTGEMGVFTGQRRSATIVAAESSAGLAITRNALNSVMDNDREMKCVILENVVKELSGRLAEANSRVDVLSSAQAQSSSVDEAPPSEESEMEASAEDSVDAEPAEDEGDEVTADGGEEELLPAEDEA